MASCPQGKEGRGSPVPWVLALPTGPAEGARSKSGGTPEHLPDSPITLPCPAHLLPFLTREAGHPRVTLQKENLVSNAIVAITMKGAWSAGVYRPDAPGTRHLTAGLGCGNSPLHLGALSSLGNPGKRNWGIVKCPLQGSEPPQLPVPPGLTQPHGPLQPRFGPFPGSDGTLSPLMPGNPWGPGIPGEPCSPLGP